MKFDLANMIQIFIIISFVLSILSYAAYIYKEKINRVHNEILKQSYISIFQYLRKLNIKDFMSFEKYGIWRYSGRF